MQKIMGEQEEGELCEGFQYWRREERGWELEEGRGVDGGALAELESEDQWHGRPCDADGKMRKEVNLCTAAAWASWGAEYWVEWESSCKLLPHVSAHPWPAPSQSCSPRWRTDSLYPTPRLSVALDLLCQHS